MNTPQIQCAHNILNKKTGLYNRCQRYENNTYCWMHRPLYEPVTRSAITRPTISITSVQQPIQEPTLTPTQQYIHDRQIYDSSNYKEFDLTYCCFCGDLCNPQSQSCGKCPRKI